MLGPVRVPSVRFLCRPALVAAGLLLVAGCGDDADSLDTEARERYRQHLDTLRRKTVEILATYGPTLTELRDDSWVGIYYDVGSAAALLSGGTDNYLVQARMRDIRQAAAQSDPEGWLAQRLVTNEQED